MKIKYVDIQNFRKLKKCEVEISEKQTIFVGANNSGKTSAIIAMQYFIERKKLSGTDISLCNWDAINEIGKRWLVDESIDLKKDEKDLIKLMPTLDVWISLIPSEYFHFQGTLTSIGSFGRLAGFRSIYMPKKLEDLFKDFIEKKNRVSEIETHIEAKSKKRPELWPRNLKEFIEERIESYFEYKTYALDSSRLALEPEGERCFDLPSKSLPLKKDILSNIVKISMIPASRGFNDTNEEKVGYNGKLSSQLQSYYSHFLDPTDGPSNDDADALMAIINAKETFDNELKRSFEEPFNELENVGYPGVSSPRLVLSSKVEPVTSLNHRSAVQYEIDRFKGEDGNEPYRLPEQYNGLGYQNLISMVFHLIRFRDEWLKKVKVEKDEDEQALKIQPIHLVLIEEPEAHLHSQVQQVFIRKAMEILGNDDWLRKNCNYKSQMVLSTHSGDIAHEVDFSDLRYFERLEVNNSTTIPMVKVKNLSKVFGNGDNTTRFVKRYLKSTHCDLFFADGIIAVEGAAERMLVPQFIEHHYRELSTSYISLLEIGGSHAHRLKPLIELLNVPTLIITDLDAAIKNDNGRWEKKMPQKGGKQQTNNGTIKKWVICENDIDKLLSLSFDKKVSGNTRIAYQGEVDITHRKKNIKFVANTFEDALFYHNIEFFGNQDGGSMMKGLKEAAKMSSKDDVMQGAFDAIKKGNKGEFALDLLMAEKFSDLVIPKYIAEGLKWIEEELNKRKKNLSLSESLTKEAE
ncbi:ATP-dependent endonuclease [Gottschalkiaceae bacterium SANA]|nr:ATP-dependent endonuclease [Gottschalkiaceae bacterium SANA]